MTPEIKAAILIAAKTDKTYSEVAELYGVTRNIVAGMVYREKPSHQRKPRIRASVPRPPEIKRERLALSTIPEPVKIVSAPIIHTKPEYKGPCDILSLRSGQCKYGVFEREGRHFFCAEATGDVTKSYCPEHTLVCHPPRQTRAASSDHTNALRRAAMLRRHGSNPLEALDSK